MLHSPKHRCPYCPHFTGEETNRGGSLPGATRLAGRWGAGTRSGRCSPGPWGGLQAHEARRAGQELCPTPRPGGGLPGGRRAPQHTEWLTGASSGRDLGPEKLGNLQAGDRRLPAQPRGTQPRERGHTASTACREPAAPPPRHAAPALPAVTPPGGPAGPLHPRCSQRRQRGRPRAFSGQAMGGRPLPGPRATGQRLLQPQQSNMWRNWPGGPAPEPAAGAPSHGAHGAQGARGGRLALPRGTPRHTGLADRVGTPRRCPSTT